MDQLKRLDASTGRSIQDILIPTAKIFTPLLIKNREAILSIPRKEESYGPHPRQKLDVYLPPSLSSKTPILVFFYGGGLIRGDKIAPIIPDGLLYHNLGTFYANRGITTIIADYRRVNSEFGGEDAAFPSGGEDVALVMKWLEGFSHKGSGNVVAMGNSAGGVHLSTFLFSPQFIEQRKSVASGGKGIKLVGGVGIGVPSHFSTAERGRAETLERYYGSSKDIEERSPYGLLKAVTNKGLSRGEIGVPKLLWLLGEFDPENEIAQPMRDFAELEEKTWGSVDFRIIKGHNHISPPQALMSGDSDGEKWGEDVAEWIKALDN